MGERPPKIQFSASLPGDDDSEIGRLLREAIQNAEKKSGVTIIENLSIITNPREVTYKVYDQSRTDSPETTVIGAADLTNVLAAFLGNGLGDQTEAVAHAGRVALSVMKMKRDFLQKESAIVSDAEKKFELNKRIEEIEELIRKISDHRRESNE